MNHRRIRNLSTALAVLGGVVASAGLAHAHLYWP